MGNCSQVYLLNKKLNISIATISPISALIHGSLNIENEGTPVETLWLLDLKINTGDFDLNFSKRVLLEMQKMNLATQKVNWVK
ncbi:MAG: DUF366 family protein [Bdellovibrionaceae bacterium]|nr:DUF366 family protein [Pseudobdellovibrionaceae bacterium]